MKRDFPITINLPPKVTAAECARQIDECSAELRRAEASITVPSRQICQIIAEELRAKAARVFQDDKDLAVELETAADEFETVAMGEA